jgi:hypothetical protein
VASGADVPIQLAAHLRLGTHEAHVTAQLADRREGARDGRAGGMIPTHGVERDPWR